MRAVAGFFVAHLAACQFSAAALSGDDDTAPPGDGGSDGSGSDATPPPPDAAAASCFPGISAGRGHTCAVRSDATLWCWGSNAYGKLGLGDGAPTSVQSPTLVPLPVPAAQVSAGRFGTCAVGTDGSAWCWGRNDAGQVGYGAISTQEIDPLQVSGLNGGVAEVQVGHSHSCARLVDGTVRCWGNGQSGKLGDGAGASSPVPVVVSGLTQAKALTLQSRFTCAIREDGTVWCWGNNATGELGDGSGASFQSVPVRAGTIADAIDVDSGSHACALHAGGTVSCWGWNALGEVGDGTQTSQPLPVVVAGLTDVTAIAMGGKRSCAVSGGTVVCWGDAGYQAGTSYAGSPMNLMPTPVSTGAIDLTVGGYHACATTAAGLRCWGMNDAGQLGDGTNTNRDAPVDVPLSCP